MSVNGIGRVRYVQFNMIVPGKEPFHVCYEASISTSQSFVDVVAFSRFGVHRLFFQEGFPLDILVVQPTFK